MVIRGFKHEAPASLESLHRMIMGAAHTVEKDSAHFQQMYLSNIDIDDSLEDFIREISEVMGKEISDLQDFNDLELLITESKETERPDANAPVVKKSKAKKDQKEEEEEDDIPQNKVYFGDAPEYKKLKKIFERSKAFDYIGFSLKNKIADAFSKLQTYCLSFIPETKGEVCNSVQDYENRIIDWKHALQIKLDQVDEFLDEYDRYKSKPIIYIGEYGSVIDLQRNTCRTLISMCDPIKKWVTSDSTYARRLQEEVSQYNRQKLERKDAIKHIEDDREKVSLTIKRKAFQVSNFEKELDRARENKKNIRRREADTQENLAKVRADARRKRRDLEDAKSRFTTRKDNSPSLFNYLSTMIETLKSEVRGHEVRCSMMHKNVITLQKEQEMVQTEINAIDRELRECRAAHDQLYQKLEKLDYSHWKQAEHINQLEIKITALKRIREIKLHTNTVKKLFHFGYHAGHMQERDELKDAMKIASEEVGKEWAYLYQKLPFKPARGFEERSHDIEVIDLSSRRVQSGGFRTVTYKSLEKWRRLHSTASLPDLVKTLKKMRKIDAIRRIQKEVMVQSPVAKTRPRPYGRRHGKTAKSTVTV